MKQYVIIAGAGISAAPPSNLPSWWEYNKKLITQIKAGALELCPEASNILTYIDPENSLPVQCISQLVVSQGAGTSYFPLLELLDGTTPNANHIALAELAQHGKLKSVITTNFDTLIETAFRNNAIPLYTITHQSEYYEASQVSTCKLIKIHGSVNDHTTLIDTISQKAIGLSPEKQLLLKKIFSNSELLVIGFSGADLDFDINYIPFMQALEEGSTLTWIIRPKSVPHPNVIMLQKRFPDRVIVKETELSELFQSMGIHYEKIQKSIEDSSHPSNTNTLDQKIKELFSSAHIGPHGCIGYCLSLLEMLNEKQKAAELAKIYEQKLDWSSLSIFSALGLNALARQKLIEQDWKGCIRCYMAVSQCHQQMNELNNTPEISPEQKKSQQLEHATNMATVYQNLGTAYYYWFLYGNGNALKEAEKMLKKAYSIMQDNPTIPLHSYITFNIGRVEYANTQDYDQYLNTLRISRDHAQKEGRLDTLAEILHEECSVRMKIGEYHLAEQALSVSNNILKNVGYVALKHHWDQLYAEYQVRTGNSDHPSTKLYIQKQQELLKDPVRKLLITLESQKQIIKIPALLSVLCSNYLKTENWLRLEDLAMCYLNAAFTDMQRSNALYLLGCAKMEQKYYIAAENHFSQIISLGKNANQRKLGWAHAELSRLHSQKKDIQQAIYHFDKCLHILKKHKYNEDLAVAGVNCIKTLFISNYFEEAKKCATQLLELIDKTEVVKVNNHLDFLRTTHQTIEFNDPQNQPAHVIATEANTLYLNGNLKQAWDWMSLAQKKYLTSNDMVGVGRCENNMANWCLKEGNPSLAATHFKAALKIKSTIGDLSGMANQLAALLQLFLNQSDYENAQEIACYIEQNMPRFSHTQEKYILYFGLCRYMLHTQNYASALTYGKKAEEGLKYLPDISQETIEHLSEIICLLKSIFEQQTPQQNLTEYEKQLQEAIRLYKANRLTESLNILEQLRCQYGEDTIKKGVIEGTCANAYLHHKQYNIAIRHFYKALHIFESADEKQQDSAHEFRLVALNGIAIALGHLGQNEEALDLFRRTLKQTTLPRNSEIQLTINLCNRLIMHYQDSIEQDNRLVNEIINMLDSISNRYILNHEEQGTIYCTYGLLYSATNNTASAKKFYQQAKSEYLITNSSHIEQVNLILASLTETDQEEET